MLGTELGVMEALGRWKEAAGWTQPGSSPVWLQGNKTLQRKAPGWNSLPQNLLHRASPPSPSCVGSEGVHTRGIFLQSYTTGGDSCGCQ